MQSQTKLKKTEAIGKDGIHYTKDDVRKLIKTDDRWLNKSLKFLFSQQTRSEQVTETTQVHNSVGFSAAHASVLSYYTRWISSGKNLTGRHRAKAQEIVSMYAQQVLNEIKRKAEETGTNPA